MEHDPRNPYGLPSFMAYIHFGSRPIIKFSRSDCTACYAEREHEVGLLVHMEQAHLTWNQREIEPSFPYLQLYFALHHSLVGRKMIRPFQV